MRALDKIRRNIIKLRKEKSLTQEKLAYKSAVSKGFLNDFEKGEKGIGIDTLEKLAETLEVEMGDLFR